jgi:vancomycin permeability regulator SanA
MIFKRIKMILSITIISIFSIIIILGITRLVVGLITSPRVYSQQAVPPHRAAIVFGAGLWRDGSPTPVLQDRVKTAADLYFAGKVEKLLLSGDNRFEDYNEPAAMHKYALELGVPDSAMVLDYAGRRTYDTCYRAKAIFGLQDAILVTQQFHLPRALVLCNGMGIQADAVEANSQVYRKISLLYWNARELPATFVALWEVYISHPLPVLGDPEPIFPD